MALLQASHGEVRVVGLEGVAHSLTETNFEEYDFSRFLDRTINPTRFYMLLMYALIRANGLRSLVELGTYRGQTTLFFAQAARLNGGHVWTYDNGYDKVEPAIAADRLAAHGLSSYVTFIRSHSFIPTLPEEADLVFVDADHTFGGVSADWVAWHERVKHFMCFHDTVGSDGVRVFVETHFPRTGWEHLHSPGDSGLLVARKVNA